MEKQVYNLETSYLNDSSTHGNVLKGFLGFLGPAKTQKCAPLNALGARIARDGRRCLGLAGRTARATSRRRTRGSCSRFEPRTYVVICAKDDFRAE